MSTYPAIYAANMTDHQRAIYYAELSVVQKDEVLGVLLAVFLGTFGAHHFYMRRTGLGILYCFLSVTGFSTIAGFVEAFFMPERVRRFNAEQAGTIATHLGFYPGGGGTPGTYIPSTALLASGYGAGVYAAGLADATPAVCSSCSAPLVRGVKFCSRCGTPTQAQPTQSQPTTQQATAQPQPPTSPDN